MDIANPSLPAPKVTQSTLPDPPILLQNGKCTLINLDTKTSTLYP
jgi:hypothetical protein